MENIVLIVMDTLSAFNTSLHGYERETTPFLDNFAEQNSYVQFGYSNAPWTAPSHASLFSGKLPSEHGTSTHNYKFEGDSFVEDLKDKGYKTIGISQNPLISEMLGFDKGFDELHSDDQKIIFRNQVGDELADSIQEKNKLVEGEGVTRYLILGAKVLKENGVSSTISGAKFLINKKLGEGFEGADQANQMAKNKIEESKEPFFLFINYMQPHAPYQPPESTLGTWSKEPEKAKEVAHNFHYDNKTKWWEEYPEDIVDDIRSLYDEEILYMDSKIEEIVSYIQENHEDTKFIIVSDHGENINHYGMRGHNCGIWERLIRVPIVIGGAGADNQVVEGPVSLRALKDVILGEKTLSEVTQKEVKAEYKGVRGTLNYHNESEEDYNESEMRYINNKSSCLANKDKGIIKNTKLDNFAFRSQISGYDESGIEIINVKSLDKKLNQPFDVY